MEKVTLKLFEFYNLEVELNGAINPQTGEVVSKGLLNEKIKLTTKYWLTDLAKRVSEIKQDIEKIKEQLVIKYGESDQNGNLYIPMYVEKPVDQQTDDAPRDVNPKFLEFQNEFNRLLQEERDLEYKALSLEDLESVESEGSYSTLFKLIKVDE